MSSITKASALLFCVALAGCGYHSEMVHHRYLVKDKMYQADTRRTDLAPVFGHKGMHFALVSSGSYEQYDLLVKEGYEDAHSIRVTANQYAGVEKGGYIDIDQEEFVKDKK